MNYPLISEYIEAIKSAEDNFEELSYLRPVLGDDGLPVMTSGNFAVVFKMKDEQSGKFYAVKCFTKEQEGRAEAYREITNELKDVSSPYLTSVRYLDKELFVDTDQTTETEFPVLLMDWVEGKTLDKYLYNHHDDKSILEMLAYRFSGLTQWLIAQPFAHGDLKPDNIIVRENGSLVLIDYDGMYVPAMKGQKSRELGAPDFRHPLRSENDFDEHIDDFSLLSIFLSLEAIAFNPSFLNKYGSCSSLLFSNKDYINIENCSFLKIEFPTSSFELNRLCAILVLSLSDINFKINLNKLSAPECISNYIEVTETDLKECFIDEYGIKYSSGTEKLISCDNKETLIHYSIKDNTMTIGSWAFAHCEALRSLILSSSVVRIGTRAFSFCSSLLKIDFPDSVRSIGEAAFESCNSIESLIIPSSVMDISSFAFSFCTSLRSVTFYGSVDCIESYVFWGCYSLESISLPKNIKVIGWMAFQDCISLNKIKLPDYLRKIEGHAFANCCKLQDVTIPSQVEVVCNGAFRNCTSLEAVHIMNPHITIAHDAFEGDNLNLKMYVPKGSTQYFQKMLGYHVYIEN